MIRRLSSHGSKTKLKLKKKKSSNSSDVVVVAKEDWAQLTPLAGIAK